MAQVPSDAGKSTKANQSGEKLLRIIEYMAYHKEPVRVLDLSKALGINSSTALRFLLTLKNTGYVDQDPVSSRYFLTFKLCFLADHVSSSLDLRTLARPFLKQASVAFGESVCLAVERDLMVSYIDVVEGPDSMVRSMQRIGNIAPMHCTGIGKLFLMEAGKLDQLIETKGLVRFTEHTLTSRQALSQELARVREQGYAYDNEECEIGARCVAFPIRDYTGKVIAGFSVTGPASRLTDAFITPRLPFLKGISDSISEKLGFDGEENR